jgi:uncharacterized protein (TIGR04222 family)
VNPFTWNGPAFLGFYALLIVAVWAALWLRTRLGPASSTVRVSTLTAEPYKIACLRAGETEAIRMAVFNLIDRGLLTLAGPAITRVKSDAGEMVTRPLDKAIIAASAAQPSLAEIARNATVRKHAAAYAKELSDAGLIADSGERNTRFILLACAIGLLAGVAFAKIIVAIATGHRNIFFLIIAALVASILTIFIGRGIRTRAGASVLADLKTLTAKLKREAPNLKMGSGTNDALLLAAVHGFAVLPLSFHFLRPYFTALRQGQGDSGVGSSCGSSGCGSSGGSGCGGGGGCGGCGSE